MGVYLSVESIITHAGLYLHQIHGNAPIHLDQVAETAKFIHSIFRNEFLPIQGELTTDMIEDVMGMAVKLKMINRSEGNQFVKSEDIHG